MRDNFEADWTACDMSADPNYKAPGEPKKLTLYEDTALWIVGYRYPAFWRPSNATVRIGDHVEKGIHLLQVWLRRTDGAEEVLVLVSAGRLLASASDDAAQYAQHAVRIVVSRGAH